MVGVTVEATATNSRGQLFFVMVWLLTTMMLVLALQTISVPQALGDDGASGASDPTADFPSAGFDFSDVDDPSVLYSGALWSVTDSRANAAEGLLARSSVEIDVTITNTLENAQIRVPDSMIALVSTNGDVLTNGRFVDAGARLAIEPGESEAVTIYFEVGFTQRPSLSTLALQIGELNRVPASINLAGAQDASDFPIFAAVDTASLSTVDPDNSSRQLVIEPVAATVDVNAGPYRAAVGEQLAVVKVEVQRTEPDEEAGFLDTGYWALEADGTAVPAIFVEASPTTSSNTDEVTLLFAFPEGTDDLQVVAGVSTDDTVGFAIVLPN